MDELFSVLKPSFVFRWLCREDRAKIQSVATRVLCSKNPTPTSYLKEKELYCHRNALRSIACPFRFCGGRGNAEPQTVWEFVIFFFCCCPPQSIRLWSDLLKYGGRSHFQLILILVPGNKRYPASGGRFIGAKKFMKERKNTWPTVVYEACRDHHYYYYMDTYITW